VGAVRPGAGGALGRPPRPGSTGRLLSATVEKSLYPQRGWTTAPFGDSQTGDKIVQPALVTVLQGIYEEDFKGFS